MRRLTLLEVAPHEPERRFRTEAYPYLMAAAAAAGWPCEWHAVGVPYEPTLRYALGPRELAAVLAALRLAEPSVIVVNERLSPEQEALLAQGGARLVYCPLGEDMPARLPGFLEAELPELSRASVSAEDLAPVFDRRPLNDAPGVLDPLVRVAAGNRCAYRCSFCGTRHDAETVREPLVFALRQLEAACRARQDPERELRFELIGARLWRRLEDFLDQALRRGISNAELDFMPRVDEILESREAVLRWLPRLAEAGLALRFYGAGVENFSRAENARLNKGVSPEQVHEAAAFLTETARRWPGTFRFEQLSMILFTPWTTLEDLRENLGHIARCPVICPATAAGSRLQLFEGRPITALASQEGLMSADSRAFYNSGCIVENGVEELPWRFLRPEVEGLCELGRLLRTAGAALPDQVVLAILGAALTEVEKDRRPRSLAELLPAAAALAREAALVRARAVEDILREAGGRARFRDGLVELCLEGKAYPLLLCPRSQPGPSFFDLPSFRVCLRGEVAMSPEEQDLLLRWLARLAPLDGRLAQALPAAASCEAAARRFGARI